jgi:hypothetical protein
METQLDESPGFPAWFISNHAGKPECVAGMIERIIPGFCRSL